MKTRKWCEIEKMRRVTVWNSDLNDIKYLREKMLMGLNRDFIKVVGVCENFLVVECEECVARWLYNQEKPEGVL